MVFAINGQFVLFVFLSVKVSRLKCFLLFSLGGHRSLLRAVLICQCAAFDGYVTMVDWKSCIRSGLSVLLFSAPDVIAFYPVGHHHWASNVVSCAHVLIPLLWKLDKCASILAVAL